MIETNIENKNPMPKFFPEHLFNKPPTQNQPLQSKVKVAPLNYKQLTIIPYHNTIINNNLSSNKRNNNVRMKLALN